MIGYMTFGTNDLEKAGKFYDELFEIIGAKRFMSDDHIILWATKQGIGMFSVITPNDGKAATVGNGTMAAFAVDSLDTIKRMHTKVLELGGSDEGEPGPRGDSFNFGYARDLEGNKMAFYCMQ
jgi:predicted enzyme related to lactoylglutathione lyase